ncbi:uncharacterized protein LOC120288532 [Eucalyptus grandis]|uniref:uncharacterized protein LOC120288532 n=1 Tax=Eucalyptus grandis TaxID=71139 RepID=UPI00192EE8C4|nr:uncharacterized protein LOC120288532 [Eucalyptus grandis]
MHEQAKVAVKQASDTSAGRSAGLWCGGGRQELEAVASGVAREGSMARSPAAGSEGSTGYWCDRRAEAQASCRSQVTGEGSGSGGAVWIAASAAGLRLQTVSGKASMTGEQQSRCRCGGRAGGASDAGRAGRRVAAAVTASRAASDASRQESGGKRRSRREVGRRGGRGTPRRAAEVRMTG